MNTISEILKNQYLDQGIKNLEVFYDTLFFRLKIKDGAEYKDTILIEKIEFDYTNETVDRIKNAIMVDFGDTESSEPSTTTGNSVLGCFLDKRDKGVWIVGLKIATNGNTVPIIYKYDINSHSIKSVFPNPNQIEDFESFSGFDYVGSANATVQYDNDKIVISFQTTDSTFLYIEVIVIKVSKSTATVESYNMFKYSPTVPVLQLTGADTKNIFYSIGDYHGKLDWN
jgi:hypothetical protein